MHDSIEEWFESVRAVVLHHLEATDAAGQLFPKGRWVSDNLACWKIDWEDVERVSRPFLFAVEPMRRALKAKVKALIDVTAERWRYLPDDAIAPEQPEVFAAHRELRALPAGPFAPRPKRISAHALALYELIAPNIPPGRHRDVRHPSEPQPYNTHAMNLVSEILAHYYGAPVRNIRSRLQAARNARDRG